MNTTELKNIQAPLKEKYRDQPESAVITLMAQGRIGEGISCKVETGKAMVEVGIEIRGGKITAEGDLDFKGTLGVSKEAPVGFKIIRLSFDLDTDATEEQIASIKKLTERYCVVYQTLTKGVPVETHYAAS